METMNGIAKRDKLHAEIYGDVPHMPNADTLGTPMESERIQAMRREQRFDRWFRLGGLIVLLGVFAMIGVSSRATREAVDGDIRYREKAQRLVAGKMSCALDQYEGCLRCLHKDLAGQIVISNHC